MIAVEYHDDLKEVQSDPSLMALLSPAQADAPFDRIAWWQLLREHCGLGGKLAIARDGDCLAVLPLAMANGRMESLSNWYTFRFRPILSNSSGADACLEAIAQDLANETNRIVLSGVPDEDGSASRVERAFKRMGWFVSREQCDTNHVLQVRGRTWDEYHAGLPGKLRTTLKRKTMKIECRIVEHFDEDMWRAYEAIYAQSWKPEEGSPDFLREFSRQEGNAGRLRLATAHAADGSFDGEAIAAQMWTVEGCAAFIHKLAHREDAKPLSPGSVLSAALFRHVIEKDEVGLVDFGTGDDAYKRDWMEEVRPRYRLDMMRPLSPRNWLIFAKTGLQRLAGRSEGS